jgi:hypothetical protein
MRVSFLSILLLIFALPVSAQQSPAEFLGYELGEQFTPHHRVMDYVRHVAEHSDRVVVQPYGVTYEGRELMVAYVSSPAHIASLDAVRRGNLQRANLEPGSAPTDNPVVVWLSYNVHGNESVSSEAALQTLYELADERNTRTGAWLENTVVVMDPMINPDGRDRYVNWYRQQLGQWQDADPDATEHNEPWPGGRTNHYYFDLNRDWAWLTQQETRARLALYNTWMPQVHVDFHEQGIDSPYYFAPAAEPYHPVITDWQRTFQETIGRNHARYFDANGWLYFTGQVFDLFYPGYGDTYPTYNGAIGMTYEQGGSGRAGLAVETAEGDTLTLAMRIAGHYTTGMSTVEVAAAHAGELTSEFETFFDRASRSGPDGVRAWVLRSPAGPERLAALAAHLDGLGIAYGTPTAEASRRGWSYRSRTTGSVSLRPGDLVVPAAQPRGTMARVLFEAESAIPDSLTYDITAWALPYAYDLDAWTVDADVALGTWVPTAATAAGGTDAGTSTTQVPNASSLPYAWISAWQDAGDAPFLAALLKAGVRVRFTERPMTVDGRSYHPGALIVTRRGNEGFGVTLPALLADLASQHGQVMQSLQTGMVEDGPDLGSSDIHHLEAPRVAMLTGSPASSASVGELWHLFDEVWRYPVTRIQAEDIRSVDLDDYDVLLLPSGNYSRIWPDDQLDGLRSWIRSGGRLVAIEGAASWLTGKDGFALKAAPRDEPADSVRTAMARDKVYAERERDRLASDNPGAVFTAEVDTTHPLGYGLSDTTWILRRRADGPVVMTGSNAWNTGMVGERVSGHVGYRAEPRIQGTLAFGAEEMGRGTVVYFVDNPVFRGFWYAGRHLLANAVFFTGP